MLKPGLVSPPVMVSTYFLPAFARARRHPLSVVPEARSQTTPERAGLSGLLLRSNAGFQGDPPGASEPERPQQSGRSQEEQDRAQGEARRLCALLTDNTVVM